MKEELERNELKSITILIPIIMLSNRSRWFIWKNEFVDALESNRKLAQIHDLPLATLIEKFEYYFSKIYAERDVKS